MRTVSLLVLTLSVVIVCDDAAAASIRVPADQPTIAEAIAVATAGDTVLVAPGTYEVQNLILIANLTLLGDPQVPGGVILQAAPANRVLTCQNVEGVVLENLVITGGRRLAGWKDDAGGGVRCVNARVRLSDCQFNDNRASIGAGLALDSSQAIIERCAFVDNHATHDGWAAGGGIWSHQSHGDVVDCTFDQNSAFSTSAPGDGGGLFTELGALTVSGCSFTHNETGAGGAGFYSFDQDSSQVVDCTFTANTATWGGAAFLEHSFASLTRCEFIANVGSGGAGVVETISGNHRFVDCRFLDNIATTGDGGAIQSWGSVLALDGCLLRGNTAPSGGGAVFMRGVTATFDDCIFQDNAAPRGAAIRCQMLSPQLNRCTFVGNRATVGGAALYLENQAGANLDRCIIAFSPAGSSFAGISTTPVTLTCSDIFGNAAGDWVGAIADQLDQNGNLSVDPLFCDLAAGDLHLRRSSPCAEENNASCGQIGALPVGCDLVAVPPAAAQILTVRAPAPNPFNPSTTLRFVLGQSAWTAVDVVDIAGRRVRQLAAAALEPGDHEVVWDGRDDAARLCPAGVYHAVVSAGPERASVRLALVK